MPFFATAADAGRELRDDLRVIADEFGRQDIFFHAGSVAYSALLAGVPFLLLLASALGYLANIMPASDQTIARFLRQLLPAQTASDALPLVRQILIDVAAKRSALGLIGVPLFLWFSTRFSGSLRASLGSVFSVERGHGLIRGKMLDMWYVLVGTLFVTAFLALNTYLSLPAHVGTAVGQVFGVESEFTSYVRRFVRTTTSTAFLTVMFTAIYKYLPNRRVGWSSALWGGVWGALLFELTRTVLFQLVARAMNPASLYSGTLAAIVVVVFWAYYAAVIFLIGGVIARVHEVRGHRKSASSLRQS